MDKEKVKIRVKRLKHKTLCCKIVKYWEGKELDIATLDKQGAFWLGSELIKATLKPGTYEIIVEER